MLQKELRKFLVFMAKVSWPITKSETGFQSFILATNHWEMNPNQNVHQTSKQDALIGRMQSTFSRISTWPQHILIHNLLPLEKRKVSKMDIWVPHILSKKDKEELMPIATSQINYSFLKNIITSDKKKKKKKKKMGMFNAKGSGLTNMNLCSLHRMWNFMEEKLCCVYGGITAVLFLLSF